MKVTIVDDPRKVMVRDGRRDPETGEWTEGECCVLREDVDNAKAFAKELMQESNMRVRQSWEHDYYKQVKEQYSGQVAGAWLMKVWDWTKTGVPEQKKPESSRTWGTQDLASVAQRILERIEQ